MSSDQPSTNHPKSRHKLLIEVNTRWLLQAGALLEKISDDAYAGMPAGVEPHRVGAHLRHILEFYDCFLCGMRTGYIDYDARRRDPVIERSRAEAARRAVSLREGDGPFKSLEDFRYRVGLSMDVLIRISPHVSVISMSTRPGGGSATRTGGRIANA